MLKITIVTSGQWREKCYVISNEFQECLIFDPGEGANEILALVQKHQLKPSAILCTHAHFDHVASVAYLQKHLQIPFYLHEKDLVLLKRANLYASIFGSKKAIELPEVEVIIKGEFQSFQIASFSIESLHFPGHTAGSVCFKTESLLIVGDLLYRGKIGRTDLSGGNAAQMTASLQKLQTLDQNLRVLPGHGTETRLGDEFQQNTELRAMLESAKAVNSSI